jgi:hypothetical protein
MRSALVPLLVVLCSACEDAPSSFTDMRSDVPPGFDIPNRDIPQVDRGMAPEVVDLTDVPPLLDAGFRDGPCAESVPGGDLRFGREGGLRFDVTTYSVSSPRRFLLERSMAGGPTARCETTIPACGATDDVTVDVLATALNSPDVAAAFQAATASDAGTVFYGVDSRPIDGEVFFVTRNGRFVYVGDPCRTGSGSGCVTAPVGVQRLVDVLNALQEQESRRPVCRAALVPSG